MLLAEEISTTLDHLGGCPNDLGLVPLTFRVQEFALVVGDERPFLHQHRKRVQVCFQYLYLKVICSFFVSPPVSFQTVALKLKKICNINIDWAVISPQSEQGGFFFWERVPGDCDYGACGEILVQATDTF